MFYHNAQEITPDAMPHMLDALVEHNPDDPAFGDPASWPAEWDDDVVALGAALMAQETWDDLPGDGLDDLPVSF